MCLLRTWCSHLGNEVSGAEWVEYWQSIYRAYKQLQVWFQAEIERKIENRGMENTGYYHKDISPSYFQVHKLIKHINGMTEYKYKESIVKDTTASPASFGICTGLHFWQYSNHSFCQAGNLLILITKLWV